MRYGVVWIAIIWAISDYDARENSREVGTFWRLHRVATSIAAYVDGEKGELPDNINDLSMVVQRTTSLGEPIPAAELIDAWGHGFQLRVIDKSKIEIYSPGRNGKIGSPQDRVFSDDIRLTITSAGEIKHIPEPPNSYMSWPIRVRFFPLRTNEE